MMKWIFIFIFNPQPPKQHFWLVEHSDRWTYTIQTAGPVTSNPWGLTFFRIRIQPFSSIYPYSRLIDNNKNFFLKCFSFIKKLTNKKIFYLGIRQVNFKVILHWFEAILFAWIRIGIRMKMMKSGSRSRSLILCRYGWSATLGTCHLPKFFPFYSFFHFLYLPPPTQTSLHCVLILVMRIRMDPHSFDPDPHPHDRNALPNPDPGVKKM